MIKLFGKPIRVNKSSQDKKSQDVGANLFIGNLDPDVDEKVHSPLVKLTAIFDLQILDEGGLRFQFSWTCRSVALLMGLVKANLLCFSQPAPSEFSSLQFVCF